MRRFTPSVPARRIIDNGTSPDIGDYDNRTALHLASSEGNTKVVERLIIARADVNVRDRWGNTPLMDAVTHKHEAAARMLLEAGGRMNIEDSSSMMCEAASAGDLTKLQLL